ncbi:MAG: hypothetical protein ACKV22_20175 [Bryobacteraceae bacterium]
MTRRALWFLLAMQVPAVPAAEAPAITVHLYDLASVPEEVLAQAADITTRIYAGAGVQLHWVRHEAPTAKLGLGNPFRPNPTPAEVSVRLLPKHLSRKLARPGSPMVGIAYPVGQGDYRFLATLLYDRVELAARSYGVSASWLLGHLITHELGHLLLGPGAHARATIMACPWDTNEVRDAKRGWLRFAATQAVTLRSNVASRLEAAASKAGEPAILAEAAPPTAAR